MRDRLVAALVGMTVAVVAIYGIPRAYLLADLVQDSETRKVERSVDLLAVVVTQRKGEAADVTEAFLAPLLNTAESIEYAAPDGTVVRAGVPSSQDSPEDIVRSRALADGAQVTLRRSAALVEDRVSDALLPLVLLGLGLIAGAVGVGLFLARRLSQPFGELAAVATDIGRGKFDVEVPHYAVSEAEAIGDALRQGSARLDDLMRRERDFAANASHELRTPIAALRLELEDLASWPQTPPDVSAELLSYLPELDRLSVAIREYLDTARDQRLTDVVTVDLATLVSEAVGRWRPQVTGQVLVHEPGPHLTVRASPAVVAEILDQLLQDTTARGFASISVEVGDSGDYARVRLTGTGLGTGEPDSGRKGHPSGGHDAAAAALSIGGHVSAPGGDGATVVLALPRPGIGLRRAAVPPAPTPADEASDASTSSAPPNGELAVPLDEVIAGLDAATSALLRQLRERSTWSRAEFEVLAASFGVMPDGAIDMLNEAAIDATGEPVIEGDDDLDINPEGLEGLLA